MILTPLTKLDAVNEICGAMGEAPVDTLENSENVDTINAVRMLEAETRAIQVMGWTFNTINPFIFRNFAAESKNYSLLRNGIYRKAISRTCARHRRGRWKRDN